MSSSQTGHKAGAAFNEHGRLRHWGDGAIAMTPDFLAGIFFVLIPSMIVVAWFVWRASAADRDPRRKSLDRTVDERGSQNEFDVSERSVH